MGYGTYVAELEIVYTDHNTYDTSVASAFVRKATCLAARN